MLCKLSGTIKILLLPSCHLLLRKEEMVRVSLGTRPCV